MKELIAECRARVALIEQSNRDQNTFARRYADDVPKLIAEIERLEAERSGAKNELEFARRRP